MFEGQPKGLYALALANTGERFGYYTMLAIFVLFLRANFDLSASTAGNIYAAFLATFTPHSWRWFIFSRLSAASLRTSSATERW